MAGKHASTVKLGRTYQEYLGENHARNCTPKHRAEEQTPAAKLAEAIAQAREN